MSTQAIPVGNVMSDVRDAIAEDLRQGHIIKKVARKYGVSYRDVSNVAHTYGIRLKRGAPIGSGKPETRARNDQIIAAINLGESMASVARRFDLSREYIRQIAEKLEGYTARNQKDFLHHENLKLLKPMMDHLDSGLCNRCQKHPFVETSRGLYLCELCRARRDKVAIVLSRLNSYRKHGRRRDLNQAAWTVREYGITLEEMRTY